MRNIAIIAVAVVVVMGMAGSALAANSLNAGAKAISIGYADNAVNNVPDPSGQTARPNGTIADISGRYFVDKDTAITGGIGFQLNSGDFEGSYLSFNGGIRKYLRTDDFAPFVGGQFSYITYENKINGVKQVDYSAWEFAGLFGAEYFFSKAFSVEGSIGVALGYGKNNIGPGYDTTYFGTRNMGIRANFYF